MPAYDYTCPACGHKEERIVKMEERDEQVCGSPVTVGGLKRFLGVHADESEHNQTIAASATCAVKMERDEIALTARMSDAWRF